MSDQGRTSITSRTETERKLRRTGLSTGQPSSFSGARRFGRHTRGRLGFTLVEILVVMAIMVIIFGLLFAPMMTGLSLVSRGRRHVALQDAVRLALEQVKRDLGDAVFVFEPDHYAVTAIDGNATTATLIDYSTITFVAANTDAAGNLTTPIGPATLATGAPGAPGFRAVRFTVHLRTPGSPLGSNNPFVLYRQQGTVYWDTATTRWVWRTPIDSENALTPLIDCNLAPTVSTCTLCGGAWNGYAATCQTSTCANFHTATTMHYITDAAQFVPERITGEVLSPTASSTIYKAKYGGWLGTQNNEDVLYPGGVGAILPLANAGELEPRLTVYRLLAGGLTTYLDTYSGTSLDPQLEMSWRSGAGEVRFGDWHHNGAIYNLAGGSIPFYGVTVGVGPNPTPDIYDGNGGGLTVKPHYDNDIYPIYPSLSMEPGSPTVPVAYVIDPSRHADVRPGKVVPDTVSVRLVIYPTGGQPYYQPLQQVFTYDQDKIGPNQFCALLSPDGRTMQVRFNRSEPPSPDQYGGAAALTVFAVEITYYSRFNFNPDASMGDPDDQVYVDYSTRYVVNAALSLASYVDLEPTAAGSPVLVLPTDAQVHAVQGRDQVVVRNAMQ